MAVAASGSLDPALVQFCWNVYIALLLAASAQHRERIAAERVRKALSELRQLRHLATHLVEVS